MSAQFAGKRASHLIKNRAIIVTKGNRPAGHIIANGVMRSLLRLYKPALLSDKIGTDSSVSA
jgi:hypothetical protein